MSLFGSLMGDLEDDFFGNQMNAMNMHMRSMNRMMNSFMPDPFNMLTSSPFDAGFQQQNAIMERQPGGGGHHNAMMPAGGLFGFPAMPNINRLLSGDMGAANGGSYCSSSVITMSSGPDGRPQIYQATSSTKTGPGGIRETRRTVQDSMNGVKKMAIGHHIGDRAHIIEKEEDLRSGQLEERQEFINLDEEEATEFDQEFTTRANSGRRGGGGYRNMAICAAPSQMQAIPASHSQLTIEELNDNDDEVTGAAGGAEYLNDLAGTVPPTVSNISRHKHSNHHHHRRQMPPTVANLPPEEQIMDPQQTQLLNHSSGKNNINRASTSPKSGSKISRIIDQVSPMDNDLVSATSSSLGTTALPKQQHHQSQSSRTTSSFSTSVQHPHPYNLSGPKRNRRSKQHSKKVSNDRSCEK